jgi:AcrR family transcriptional regulator
MDDIASKLGISKKTLYLHFDTKEDILLVCMDFAIRQFEEKIMVVRNTVKNPVFALVEIYRVVIMELSDFKGSYFYDIKKNNCARDKDDEYRKHFQTVHIRMLLEQAQKENYLRKDADIKILCKIFFFLTDEFIAGNAYLCPKYDLESIYRHIILFGLKGFLTPENTSLLDRYTE